MARFVSGRGGLSSCHLPASLVKRIEHFGSTAVPALAAKPVIDILVEVTSLKDTQEQIVPLLEAKGYDYFWRTDVEPPYAWFIKRNLGVFYKDAEPNGPKTEDLSIRDMNSGPASVGVG